MFVSIHDSMAAILVLSIFAAILMQLHLNKRIKALNTCYCDFHHPTSVYMLLEQNAICVQFYSLFCAIICCLTLICVCLATHHRFVCRSVVYLMHFGMLLDNTLARTRYTVYCEYGWQNSNKLLRHQIHTHAQYFG